MRDLRWPPALETVFRLLLNSSRLPGFSFLLPPSSELSGRSPYFLQCCLRGVHPTRRADLPGPSDLPQHLNTFNLTNWECYGVTLDGSNPFGEHAEDSPPC